jgi:glutathione S-transferase
MPRSRHVTLFHAPNTRSSGVRILLEELGADHEVHPINLGTNEQRGARYMAINPMGKVPAVLHHGALITEQPAIFIYLADLYPEAALAPALNDPLRGPYLRWMIFYGSSFEPALVDRALKRTPAALSTSPYGDFDTMLATLVQQLSQGPYMLGDKFSALDVLWGTALSWTTQFQLVPLLPEIAAYMERVNSRPAVARAQALDAALAAEQKR